MFGKTGRRSGCDGRGCSLSQVRIWEIPDGGLRRNMSEAVLELYGHSRRVGLIEWHPTSSGIIFSAGYDYKVLSPSPQRDRAVTPVGFHRHLRSSLSTSSSLPLRLSLFLNLSVSLHFIFSHALSLIVALPLTSYQSFSD